MPTRGGDGVTMLFRVSKLLVNTAHFRNNLQKDYRHRAASGLRASGSFAKKVSAKPARGIARAAAWIGQGGVLMAADQTALSRPPT